MLAEGLSRASLPKPREEGKYKYGRGKNSTRNKQKIIIISRKYSQNSDSKWKKSGGLTEPSQVSLAAGNFISFPPYFNFYLNQMECWKC